MALLAAAYPHVNIPRQTQELYVKFLLDVPFDMAQKAAYRLMATCKYFPAIAELREAVAQARPAEEQLPTPGEAWAEVVRQISSVGNYGKPKFTHKVIAKTVDALGWKELCLSMEPNIDRAHFFKIYQTYCWRAEQEKLNEDIARLVGKMTEFGKVAELKQINGG